MNSHKLATLCIYISPTTGWATGQTENTACVNKMSAVKMNKFIKCAISILKFKLKIGKYIFSLLFMYFSEMGFMYFLEIYLKLNLSILDLYLKKV